MAVHAVEIAFISAPPINIFSGRQSVVDYHDSRGTFTKLFDSHRGLTLVCGSDGPLSSSSSSRHIRLDEKNRVIHRFQPGRIIHFRINHASFTGAGITTHIVKLVERAAINVITTINRQNLGITLAYTPHSASSVFDIRYRRGLDAWATAFFPGDPRQMWAVEVSGLALFDESCLDFMPNILAHEFMHILGMRHWNAKTHEADEASLCWPGTRDGERRGIMTTDVHPQDIWFDQKDFDVIRAFYQEPNGARVENCTIVDVPLDLTHDRVEQLGAVERVWM